jgi:hypothetical protein
MAKIKEIRLETLKSRFRKTDLKSLGEEKTVVFKKENIKDIINK